LIPMICEAVKIPVIAAGGIATGKAMLAAFALGAEGVQIGTRFVASTESSAHPAFKQMLVDSIDGDTQLVMKKLVPVRLMKNKFLHEIKQAEENGATKEKLIEMLGKGRARLGMFEGNLDEGEFEIGQVSGLIKETKPAAKIIEEIISEFNAGSKSLNKMIF